MAPYLGEIHIFPYTFVPKGWALCDGSLLPINQYAALYSLLGVAYGGNGTTTFGLPNLMGRVVVGEGNGAGLTPRSNGQSFGHETTTLSTNNLPPHTHTASASSRAANGRASTNRPVGAIPATGGSYTDATADTGAGAPITVSVQPAGSGQAFDNAPPSLVLKYCIAIQGIYPSRS